MNSNQPRSRHTHSVRTASRNLTDYIESHPQLAPAWCLFRFAQALQIHREMAAQNLFPEASKVSNPREDVWFYFMAAAYRDAVIEWCKVFGSRDDWSHWRRAAGVSAESLYPRFLLETGMTEPEWDEARTAVKSYRDKALAHHDEDLVEMVTEFPTLRYAESAAFVMYRMLVQLAGGRSAQMPEDLEAWARRYSANRRPLIRAIGRCVETFGT